MKRSDCFADVKASCGASLSLPTYAQWLVVAVLLVLLWFAPTVGAASIGFNDRQVSVSAREQPLPEFLRDLFGQLDVPVVVSPAVKGAVNGNFSGKAQAVLRNLSAAFGLSLYFDGSVMYVYMAGETLTRTLMLPNAAAATKIKRLASEMGLVDQRNYLRTTSEGVVMVTGTRRFLEQIEELYRADSARREAPSALSFKVFTLRYAWAQDTTVNFGNRQLVVPGVASILRSLVSGGTGIPGPAGGETASRATQTKLRGQGLTRAPQQQVLGMGEESGSAGSAEAVGRAYGSARAPTDAPLQAPAAMSTPEAMVRIQADTRLNAVIVRDLAERMPDYEQLIRALDVEPVSIEIEATIIDINTDRATELGINWRWNTGRSSFLVGNGTASDRLLQPGGVPAESITPQGRGGVVSAVLGDLSQFVARVSALQTQGAARVVSSPQVVTLSNVEAIFDNSSTFYVKVAGKDEVDLFNVSAGTSLRVTPHVFKDTEGTRIKLLVNLEDAAISTTRQVDNIPFVQRSVINTQALIYEGESLLIGGLTREASESGVDGVPGLSDVPFLGRLFKTERKSTGRVERLFLIAPRLSTRRVPAVAPAKPALRSPADSGLPTPSGPVEPRMPMAPAPASAPAASTRVTSSGYASALSAADLDSAKVTQPFRAGMRNGQN
ncbi:MAG: type III secretion system outer membrane ring subunit SctC [Cytophagales bacterium]|nr:type III secretion system outer membrane ring subunit SctC [Rhizobacter sp.]